MQVAKTVLAASIAGLLFASPLPAAPGGKGGPATSPRSVSSQSAAVVPLSAEESATLAFMREEEKLPRDVYLSLNEQWGQAVFDNISRAEQRHMDSLESRLEVYEIEDPVGDETVVGSFTDAELADLYRQLLAKGEVSLLDALSVGALIEELDIQDLRDAIAESGHDDLDQAYQNLMQGSRNHLRAFVGQIESLGEAYQAQVLDEDDVDMILDEPMERGRSAAARRRGR